MKITIIQIGKTKNTEIQLLEQEFLKRLNPFTRIEIVTIKDQGEATNVSERETLKHKESQSILQKIPTDSYIFALDETGKQCTSEAFSKEIQKLKDSSRNICFIIGGVYGHHQSIRDKADKVLSFSKFTFTHEMIRFLLLEQIYRSFTIINGKKYHY